MGVLNMVDKKIETIEGIGSSSIEALSKAGITSTEKLLYVCHTKEARMDLAERTGLSESVILNWVNMSDLFRVKGITGHSAELLLASDIDTVQELAEEDAESLCRTMAEVNAEMNLNLQVPSVAAVATWIAQAKELPAIITH